MPRRQPNDTGRADPSGTPEPTEDPMQELNEVIGKRDETIGIMEGTIRELRGDKTRLQETLTRAQLRLDEITQERELLAEQLEVVSTPPNQYGTVVRILDDRTVDVMVGDHRHRVTVSPQVVTEDLAIGAQAILSGKTFAVIGIDPVFVPTGTQAKLIELSGPDKAVIEDARGERRTAIVSQCVPPAALEQGADILIHDDVVIQAVGSSTGLSLGSAARFMLAEPPDVTFDDIGGLDREVEDIVAALEDPHRYPEGYDALRKKKTFSTLFMGLPGNGKTMLAKAIANVSFQRHREDVLRHARGNFFAISGTEMFDKWLGNTEGFLRTVAGAAERLHELSGALSFIFFDDCEAFFLTRSQEISTNINASVITQFSGLMDGIRSLKGVCVIAATNRPDLMDLAILRRFDTHMTITPPDTPERARAILNKLLRNIPFDGIQHDDAVTALVRAIFSEGSENELFEVTYASGDDSEDEEDEEVFYLHHLISGKLLADIVERAKTLAIKRVKVQAPDRRIWALTMPDLLEALDIEIHSKESLPSSKETATEWIRQRGTKTRVLTFRNLRETRDAEKMRDERIDRRVL